MYIEIMYYLAALSLFGALSMVAECMLESLWRCKCQEIEDCLQPYLKYGDPSDITAMTQLQQPGVFDEYCLSVRGMGACVKDHAGSCDQPSEMSQAEIYVDITEFLCKYENRARFLELFARQRTCLSIARIQQRLVRETAQCLTDFIKDSMYTHVQIQLDNLPQSAICPYITQLGTCTMDKVQAVCGKASDFIDHVYTYVLNTSSRKLYGCQSRASHLNRRILTNIP